jgi:hypothetical protein
MKLAHLEVVRSRCERMGTSSRRWRWHRATPRRIGRDSTGPDLHVHIRCKGTVPMKQSVLAHALIAGIIIDIIVRRSDGARCTLCVVLAEAA